MFNFSSLAEMVGVPIDGEAQSLSSDGSGPGAKANDAEEATNEHVEQVVLATAAPTTSEEGDNDEKPEASEALEKTEEADGLSPPDVVISLDAPVVPLPHESEDSKQPGYVGATDRLSEVAQ